MKFFSKKLLSIFVAVCLLAGIAIPAGIFSASADETATTVVYKYDYAAIKDAVVAAGNNTVHSYVGSSPWATGVKDATIKFSYYLSGDASIVMTSGNNYGTYFFRDKTTGVSSLQPGLHTFEGTLEGFTETTTSCALYPSFTLLYKEGGTTHNIDAQLYVWDLEITSTSASMASAYTYDMTQWTGPYKSTYGGTVEKVTLDDVPTTLNNGGVYKLEYDTTETYKDYYLSFNKAKSTYQYKFSFDYFVPEGVTAHAVAGGWTEHYNSDSGLVKDATTGTSQLSEGKGSFSATVGIKGTTLPFGVRVTEGQQATIYVWNVCITAINSANSIRNSNMFAGAPWNSAAIASFMPYDETLFVNPDDGDGNGDGDEDDGGEATSGGVYEIDFAAAGTTDADEVRPLKHYYNAAMTGKTYTFSFDYYLPYGSYVGLRDYAMNGNETGFVDFAGGGRWSTLWLENGVHHYEKEFTAALSSFIPGFFAHAKHGYSTLYVWNFSLVENGTTTNLLDDVAFSGMDSAFINELDIDPALFGTSPIVAEIQFAENALTWTPALYQANAVMETGKKIELSFDYYLADDIAITLNNVSGWPNSASNEQAIKQGRGQYSGSFTLQGADQGGQSIGVFCPRFTAASATTLYVWNVKITLDGTEKIGYVNPAKQSTANEIYTIANGAKLLSGYSWKDEPLNTEPEIVVPGDPNDPIVTAIDFTQGDTWVYEVLRNANVSSEHPFTVTFEYFLPEKASLQFDSVGGWLVMEGGSKAFSVGHHTFEAKFSTDLEGSGYPVPIIAPKIINEAMNAKLYIWNMSVTVDGVEQVPNNPGEADKSITADVDESKRLTQYDWYETMDEVGGNYEDVIANKVYALRFDQYNWEINDYSINAIVYGRVRDIYAGMNLNLSFDYYIEGAATTHIFNPYAIWRDFETNPGVDFGGYIPTETSAKGHASYDFVTNTNDAKHEGGTIGIGIQQQIDYGQAIVYIWNLKLTQDGSNMNMLPEDFEWAENHMQRYGLIQELDIDPSTIGPGMTHPVFDNPDYVVIDTDTDDVVIDDNDTDNDPGDVDFGSDIDDITGSFDGEIRVDDASSIFVSYNGELEADAYLTVYKYADDELTEDALALIGDKKFAAYEVLMALGEDYLDLSGDLVVGIPVPADIDMSVVFAYGIDAYGDLFAVEAEYDVENNYVYIYTDVLGSFVLVEGELELPSDATEGDSTEGDATEGDEPTDSDRPTEGDEPADTTPDKDSKKDDNSNGWLLWAIIGGAAVLLTAGGVIIFLVIKKKKAAN